MRRKAQAAMHEAQSRREQIRQLCERIVQEFKPEKIILFGSHAYGQPTPESDLDLLMVMQFGGRAGAARLVPAHGLIPALLQTSVDEGLKGRAALRRAEEPVQESGGRATGRADRRPRAR